MTSKVNEKLYNDVFDGKNMTDFLVSKIVAEKFHIEITQSHLRKSYRSMVEKNEKFDPESLFTGSVGENMEDNYSDIDMMYVENYSVMSSAEDCDHSTPYHLSSENTSPGFVRIICKYPDLGIRAFLTHHEDGNCYVSTTKFIQYFFLKRAPEEDCYIKGPSICGYMQDSFLKYEKDNVHAITCKQWPTFMHVWAQRVTANHCLKKSIIKKILNGPCLLVAKAHKNSVDPDIEWRLSYSWAELYISSCLTLEQRRIYKFLKTIFNISKMPGSDLCSYHLKTTLFWMKEYLPTESWHRVNILRLMRCFLFVLEHRVAVQSLPIYFNTQVNIIFPGCQYFDTLRRMRDIVRDLHKGLVPSPISLIGMRNHQPYMEDEFITNRKRPFEAFMSNLLHSRTSYIPLSQRFKRRFFLSRILEKIHPFFKYQVVDNYTVLLMVFNEVTTKGKPLGISFEDKYACFCYCLREVCNSLCWNGYSIASVQLLNFAFQETGSVDSIRRVITQQAKHTVDFVVRTGTTVQPFLSNVYAVTRMYALAMYPNDVIIGREVEPCLWEITADQPDPLFGLSHSLDSFQGMLNSESFRKLRKEKRLFFHWKLSFTQTIFNLFMMRPHISVHKKKHEVQPLVQFDSKQLWDKFHMYLTSCCMGPFFIVYRIAQMLYYSPDEINHMIGRKRAHSYVTAFFGVYLQHPERPERTICSLSELQQELSEDELQKFIAIAKSHYAGDKISYNESLLLMERLLGVYQRKWQEKSALYTSLPNVWMQHAWMIPRSTSGGEERIYPNGFEYEMWLKKWKELGRKSMLPNLFPAYND